MLLRDDVFTGWKSPLSEHGAETWSHDFSTSAIVRDGTRFGPPRDRCSSAPTRACRPEFQFEHFARTEFDQPAGSIFSGHSRDCGIGGPSRLTLVAMHTQATCICEHCPSLSLDHRHSRSEE